MSVKTTVRTFKTMKIIAELMETLQVINPRLYAGVIKKAKGITKEGSTVLVLPFFYIFWKTIMYSPVVLLSAFAPNPFPFDSTKISFVF